METENQESSKGTDEGDLELVRRYQNGDERALVGLLEGHYSLIQYWVRLALEQAPWVDPDDIMQEAHIGFFEAAQQFDFSRSRNFLGFAKILAWRRMLDSSEVRIVKRTLYKNYSEVATAHARLMEKLNRGPTLDELSAETHLSINQIETALNVPAAFPFAMDESEEHLTNEDPYQSQLLSDLIGKLDSDQAEVVIRRYRGHKYREIAQALGKSVDAVKKLHERAIKKLKRQTLG